MDDQIPKEVKKKRFDELTALQNVIANEKNQKLLGTMQKVLPESLSKTDQTMLSGRTGGNKLVSFKGKSELIGQFVEVEIIDAKTWSLTGKLI